MSDAYSFDPTQMMTGLGGIANPWGPQTAPDIDPNATASTDSSATPAPAPAPAPTTGGGLGSLFGLLGGGGQAPGPVAPAGTTVQPGYQQSMIGLGLGLLSMPKYQFYGQPSRWAPVMQGYQQGAAADVARAQQANTAMHQQQQLALAQQAQRDTQALHALQMQLMTAPQTKIVQGLLGPELYQLDPLGRKPPVRIPIDGETGGVGGGAPTTFDYDENGKSPQALEAIRQRYGQEAADTVKAMSEGRMSGTGRNMQKFMNLVPTYDKNFNQQVFQARQAMEKDVASGAMGKNITSLNTVIGHLGALAEKADALDNTRFPSVNAWRNWASTQTGQAQVTGFETARNAVADELAKVFRSTGMSEADIRQWQSRLDATQSPAQLKESIRTAIDLLNSRSDALKDNYRRVMKREPDEYLSEKSQATLGKVRDWANTPDRRYGETAPAATSPTTTGGGYAPSTPPSTPAARPPRIPQQAIDMLRRNPNLRDQFEAKYGRGSADRFLSLDYDPNAT